MGLLNDAKGRERAVLLLAQHNKKLCALCYVVGLVWFLGLADHRLNARTYFSENALLPGLVDPDFYHAFGADDYLRDLKEAIKQSGTDPELSQKMPTSWLHSRFRQLGLDTYVQNYTFQYPYNILKDGLFHGSNVYSILRAPRAPGTEALVLSAPFRPQQDQDGTAAGIALMLGLAKAFRRHTYWAKDIIFLVTDGEEYGMQAWLSAYHHSHNDYIQPGELLGRSGAIQAAINLEISADSVSRFNIKVEGLNGQLPNLDLVNTVVRLCRRDGIKPALHRRTDYWNADSWNGFEHSLKTMLMMMWSQAPGTPSGNHGLFHQYNIEAVTMHGIKQRSDQQNFGFVDMGRVVEGVFRSLNNLLERFHQSFFFYLLPSTERYVSIGLYMPAFGILVLPVAIQAIALWVQSTMSQEAAVKPETTSTDEVKSDEKEHVDTVLQAGSVDNVLVYLPHFLMAMFVGIGAYRGAGYFVSTAATLRLSPHDGIGVGLLAIHVVAVVYPRLLRRKARCDGKDTPRVDVSILKCMALLTLGVILAATSVVNISLAFFIAVTWIPVIILVSPTHSRFLRLLQSLLLLLISPLGLSFCAGVVHHAIRPSPPALVDLPSAAWESVRAALLTAAVDTHMLDSWTYALGCLALLPCWVLFWLVLWSDVSTMAVDKAVAVDEAKTVDKAKTE